MVDSIVFFTLAKFPACFTITGNGIYDFIPMAVAKDDIIG
jgi:hypothetical protein